MLQLTIWSLPSLAAMLLAFDALLRIRRRGTRVPGARAIEALCVCVAVWALGQLIGTLTSSLTLKIIASQLQYPGVALLPVAWFCFALTYVRRVRTIAPGALAALAAIPAVTVAMAWSNGLHHLLWTDVRLVENPGFVGMSLDHGPWFGVHAVYSYTLVAAGTLILAYELSASRRHRSALIGVVLAPLVVTAFNLSYLSGHGLPFIDLTPLGFALGAIILARGVIHRGLLAVPPALHRQVLEELADSVVVLDSGHRTIDANAAARRMLGMSGEPASASAAALLPSLPLLREVVENGRREMTIGGRSYEVRATPVDGTGALDGRHTVLVFRDITERLQAEQALRRVKQEMEHLAHTDPLTDLPNRRYFMRRLQEERVRCQRSGRAFSVVLLDLDHFKQVNDTYGHDTGDEVLRITASIIGDGIRASDIAARWGGEEFALLLPETSREDALQVAERICVAIESREFAAGPKGSFRVTASAGVANAGSAARDDLLKLADQALYRAKDSGRNTVRC